MVATVALAASLIGVFVFTGSNSPQSTLRRGLGLGAEENLAGPCCQPTIHHPLGPRAKRVSLADATAALGASLVQPNTSLVSPSDAQAIWLIRDPVETTVAVTYPRAHLWIVYIHPLYNHIGYGDRLAADRQLALPGTIKVLDSDLALLVFHSWRQTGWHDFYPSIDFAAGGTAVTVVGRKSKAALEAIARSIIDRSDHPPRGQLGEVGGVQLFPFVPPGKRIPLSLASTTLGAPVVLPHSPLVKPSDARQAWAEGTCPHRGSRPGWGKFCEVWVSVRATGLSVGYIRAPEWAGTRGEWGEEAKGLRGAGRVLDLDGVPALAIGQDRRRHYPGRIEFDLGGNRIVVAGDYRTARLRAAAQSIVNRYPRPRERAPVVAGPTPTFSHPLGPAARRIRLVDASSTLGAPVVLPYRGLAHLAEVGAAWGEIESERRAIAVTFPSKGLILRYERPAYPRSLTNYESFLRGRGSSASVVYLNGAPGLEITKMRGRSTWTSVEFNVRGTIVVVTARGSGVHLQRIAKSILYRSRSQ